ncbi:MAG: tetratricopeptide repeat protein, partial [Deltaproteobacteria bacterium]|nr:tetratricopeptide repeat protein [Deltaproteobacteria bacterium]
MKKLVIFLVSASLAGFILFQFLGEEVEEETSVQRMERAEEGFKGIGRVIKEEGPNEEARENGEPEPGNSGNAPAGKSVQAEKPSADTVPQGQVEEGLRLLEEGNLPEAITILEKPALSEDASREAREALGYAYLGNGQVEQAGTLFSAALQKEPENPEWNFGLAMVKRQEGDHDSASKLLEKTIQLDPTDIEAKTELADLFTFDMKTRAEEAAALFAEKLEQEPGNPEAENGLAAAYLNQGKTDEALAIWEKMTQAEPENSILWSNLCEARLASGNVSEGESGCQKAIETDPANSEAYYLLAKSSKDAGDLTNAQALIQKALAIDP